MGGAERHISKLPRQLLISHYFSDYRMSQQLKMDGLGVWGITIVESITVLDSFLPSLGFLYRLRASELSCMGTISTAAHRNDLRYTNRSWGKNRSLIPGKWIIKAGFNIDHNVFCSLFPHPTWQLNLYIPFHTKFW